MAAPPSPEPAGPGAAARDDGERKAPGSHYFDAAPASPSRPATVRLTLPDLTVDLHTDRGVFSADRVDPGTKLLCLEAPPPPARGTFVDVGCGYGPLAVTLARRSPAARVLAVDVNARARELCRRNAREAGADNVEVHHPDDVGDELQVDLIWSNPPIRIGKGALHALLGRWLGRLAPTGTAVLVVARNLGADSLARWLRDEGHGVERLASRAGYRLLEVRP